MRFAECARTHRGASQRASTRLGVGHIEVIPKPTRVTSGSAAAHLPADLACDVRLVETGAELRSVLEEAE